MAYITALPVTTYATFTLAEWYHVIDTIVTLSRLCFPVPSVPDWDAVAARQSANFIPLVSGLQVKMDEVLRWMASGTLKSGKGNGENEMRRVNIPGLFSAVLSIVLKQYDERVAQDTQSDLPPDIFNFNPFFGQEKASTTYRPNASQCPVMNGSLKGTEYWDAMGAFNDNISGDVWMGGPGSGGVGDVVFEPAVVEDWYLWGTKLPEWDEGLAE
jgi:hypothetical protein